MSLRDAIALARESLIKPFEGCAKLRPDGTCEAYPDPASNGDPWTIWWGTTGPEVRPGTVWDRAQGERALDGHLAFFATGLMKMSPTLLHENDRRIAAVLSWVYNLGLGAYRVSTFKKRVDARDWSGAAAECLKWNKARGRVMRGLTRRRTAEASLML